VHRRALERVLPVAAAMRRRGNARRRVMRL
jgi:hypothetical protein